jgi:para-aminobenzoate synthetase/4-amino-4-deoxychorismate lyase
VQLVFDFPEQPGGPPRRRVFQDPAHVLTTTRVEDVQPLLDRVARETAAGAYAAGFLSYEAAPAFDTALRVRAGAQLPLAWFGIFDRVREDVSVDRPQLLWQRPASTPNLNPGGRPPRATAEASLTPQLSTFTPDTSREHYTVAIASIREALARGETYQVNYTFRLHGRVTGDIHSLYEGLRAAQGAGYPALLDLGDLCIVSASPELFFQRRGDQIISKPMKGTRPRGRFPLEDLQTAQSLVTAEKDRAENLMIVDLVRNDLGKVARPGTVIVPQMFSVERYRTVWQMTSTVTAKLRQGISLGDIFGALFPCGSITGAPKVSTMSLIASLESTPREVYCGAIGFVEPGGDATFNVPIRTLIVDARSGAAEYGVGGGITWDSTATGEYDEALAKAVLLSETWPEFELLETMPLQDGRFPRMERHLARMRASAAYFTFSFDEARVRAELAAVAQRAPEGRSRVRVLVDACGNVRTELHDLSSWPGSSLLPDASGRLPVAIAHEPVSSEDRFLFHKNTNRSVYDSRRQERPDVIDVLLVNENGHVTEFTLGNVVAEMNGIRWTPYLTAGLLAGTYREELLERGVIRERTLTVEDVRKASRLWLINSVREWTPVILTD